MAQGVKGTGPHSRYFRNGKPKKSATKRAGPTNNEMVGINANSAPVERMVTVQFDGSPKRYAYQTNDPTIAVDDLCIVIAPSSHYAERFNAAGGYPTIVKVTSVQETAESITRATKWIVQKIDLSTAIEAQAKREAIALLDAKIARETKRAQEMLTLERLRDLSPELSALIDQRNELTR